MQSQNETTAVYGNCLYCHVAHSIQNHKLSISTDRDRRTIEPLLHVEGDLAYNSLASLPCGIIQAGSDLELKPLWSTSSSREKVDVSSSHNLLAIPVGIKQKSNVDVIVQKFLSKNFTIILFHYDGNMDGWWDLPWSKNATHIVAQNQLKWVIFYFVLKNLIEKQSAHSTPKLKVILMSATVDSNLFSRYFGRCPVITAQGRTHPVSTHFLEDIYESINYLLALDSSTYLRDDTSTKKQPQGEEKSSVIWMGR